MATSGTRLSYFAVGKVIKDRAALMVIMTYIPVEQADEARE